MNKFPLPGLIAGLAVWLLVLSLPGCQTAERISPDPVSQSDSVVLYTTGQSLDTPARRYVAVYWENQRLHRLEMGTARETGCYGLQKQGNDLYIAGYFVDPDDDRTKPCYWQNGRKIDLPLPGDLAFDKAGARDLVFFQGALYLLGDIDFQPVLWKIQPGSAPKRIVLKGSPQAVAGGELSTGNLAVYNNQLFVGGVQVLETDGQPVVHPGYWTVDPNDIVRFEETDNQPVKSLSFFILPSEQGVFIAGERNDLRDRSAPTPTIWKNKTRFSLHQPVDPASQRLHEMALDSRGNLHLNILDYRRQLPVVWQVSPTGAVTETLLPVPTGSTRAFCQNLALHDDTPFYSGSYELNGDFHACFWIGNQRTEMETLNGGFLTLARTIAVPVKN
ncbi:hypothetical protein ACFPMF_23765 [Larkinella bovis]|uniref:Uncharacterized protein n=1 Tax=Larkinella bovis TaxID=683041 RepID=A0ABW0IFU8_9BACT